MYRTNTRKLAKAVVILTRMRKCNVLVLAQKNEFKPLNL